MNSSDKKKDLAQKLGKGYKPGMTRGDLMKHKAESLRIKLGK